MELEDSLLHSQEHASCSYPEPDQSNPTQTPFPSHFWKIHCNIILPSTSSSSKWSLPPMFPNQNHVNTSPFAHMCFIPSPSNSSCFDHSNNTRVGTLIVATIYLQLIQNRYMFRSFTVLQCSHQHCVQPLASDVEVVGYL